MDKYIPPYDITDEMLELVSEITEDLGKLSSMNDLERLPRLRRVNRIRSIQSSLAIENNTLSLEQVTDVIDGKHVLGPQDDIIAVKNAFSVYKMLPELDPFSLEDKHMGYGMTKDWTGNNNSIWKTLGASNHADAEREADDYYATDPIAIDKLLEVEKPRRFIWECACGGGHLS